MLLKIYNKIIFAKFNSPRKCPSIKKSAFFYEKSSCCLFTATLSVIYYLQNSLCNSFATKNNDSFVQGSADKEILLVIVYLHFTLDHFVNTEAGLSLNDTSLLSHPCAIKIFNDTGNEIFILILLYLRNNIYNRSGSGRVDVMCNRIRVHKIFGIFHFTTLHTQAFLLPPLLTFPRDTHTTETRGSYRFTRPVMKN